MLCRKHMQTHRLKRSWPLQAKKPPVIILSKDSDELVNEIMLEPEEQINEDSIVLEPDYINQTFLSDETEAIGLPNLSQENILVSRIKT